MLVVVALVVFWVGSGLLAACGCYAWFQRQFPNIAEESLHEDTVAALELALAGPIALIVISLRGMFKHGLLWPGRKP